MNKTININMAGLFFYIDEDAYMKLQRYLDAIKRSLTQAEGREEIMQDIEARIAELFAERVKHERQVISLSEVDEVIAIMGQPEDYQIDDEVFEDEPKAKSHTTSTRTKKLYRDIDNCYLGGVSSGLAHYMGIDAIWVRIVFVLLAIFTKGGFALLYLAFWIFMKAAVTTTEKLEMRGKPVNIDNIQRKVKEGFGNVADSVKNADYAKFGDRAKKSSGSLISGLGKVLKICLTVIVKLIGILLIIAGGSAVIGLFIGLFTAGTLGFMGGGLTDYINLVNASSFPLWLITLMSFFASAIPCFAFFYLGLKLLVPNLQRMSWVIKTLLIVLWLVSSVILTALIIRQAMDFSDRGEVTTTQALNLKTGDTLTVKMDGARFQNAEHFFDSDLLINHDENGSPYAIYKNFGIIIKNTADSTASMQMKRSARGFGSSGARAYAEEIVYEPKIENGVLTLPSSFSLGKNAKFRNQNLLITIYLPEGTTLFMDQNTRSFQYSMGYIGLVKRSEQLGHYLTVINGELICKECQKTGNEESKWEDDSGKDNEDSSGGTYDFDEALRRKQGDTENKTNVKDTLQTELDSINN